MVNLKITMPTYRPDSFRSLHVFGELQVSAEVDVLSDGYQALKLKLDELLRECDAENQIVLDLAKLHDTIDAKTKVLKRLQEDIILAKNQLQRLQAFLKLLGINPNEYSLDVDNKVLRPLLEARSTDEEAEVNPIPFDSSESSSEF